MRHQIQRCQITVAEPNSPRQHDPRHVLANTIERLEADGFHPVMAVELEFYLLDQQRDVNGRPQPALQANGVRPVAPQVYGVYELEQLQPFLDDLYAACALQGLPVRTAISEYAAGQVDLTREHRFDALHAIDEGVRYKRWVKGVANKHGLQACFMTKPFSDQSGSGMHLHVSLADEQGHNLYASADPQGAPLLRHSIGGMMATLFDSLAIFCPHASPYLAAAAVLAGIRYGITHQSDPGAAVEGDGYEQATDFLPADWLTALHALHRSTWAREALGAEFLNLFLAIKWREFRQLNAEVAEGTGAATSLTHEY